MFEVIGFILSIILISIAVTILVEYVKRFAFTAKVKALFESKIKKVSFYQIESIVIALIILIILSILGVVSLSIIAYILNSIIIGLISNGIFTYDIVKTMLLKFKITSKLVKI